MSDAPEPADAVNPAERVRAVLEERARALARVPEEEQADGALLVLGFTVGQQQYAVEAVLVREVVRRPIVSRVPGGPESFLGLTSVRGELIPVADLRRLLGAPQHGTADTLVVLDGIRPPLGILVDELGDLVSLPPAAVTPLPDEGAGSAGPLFVGVASGALVIGGPALLSDPRLFTTHDRSPDDTDGR